MPEDLTGQTLLGRYRIVELLGQGGMGSVWRGVHVRTGRKVAVKLLDERFLSNTGIVQRFGREARAASAIQHPGIVEVLDLDQTDRGVPFLVMELLEGETLSQRIARFGRLPQDEAVGILCQLLEALDAAHAHGVVHRDLKPDNVVLVPRGQGVGAKILDFGISQKEDERVSNLTLAGAVLGTPHYMAPEQALGESDVDGRADVYAAGVVLYECVVGQIPFDAPNYNKLIQVILHEQPAPPTQRGARIDPGLEEVILRAMDKDRDARPATAGAMLDLLQAVTSDTTMPFDRETLGFVQEGRGAEGAGGAGALAEAVAEAGPGAPSSVEVNLPELEGPPPAAQVSPAAGAPLAPDAAPGSEAPLALDEVALARARASRPARARASAPPSLGSPPGAPSEGVHVPRHAPATPAPAQVGAPWQRRPPRPVWYVLGGIGLFLILVLSLRLIVRPGEEAQVAPPRVAVQPEVPGEAAPLALRTVTIEISGLPPAASLVLDGLPAGQPPLRLRHGSSHRLEIVAPGYEGRTLEFVADGDKRLSGALRPEVGDPTEGR